MYSNEGSKTYQSRQTRWHSHRQKTANGSTRNYWQQESKTGGDDGLEKLT